MTQWLLAAGGAIFIVLGLVHAALRLRLARGGTTMWSAWLGFNFSHSLGLVIFGALCIALAVGALSRWFRVPIIATALATMCFVAAWLLR